MATLDCRSKDTHAGRGEFWQKLNVFARSRGEGKNRSRRAETNACWLLLVELWIGMEGWGNIFIPSAPIHSRPSNTPTPLSPFWKGGGWKGQPPSGSTFPSKLQTDAFWWLLDCTWYRQTPFSFKSKTDCFSLGRELLQKRNDKSKTVQLSGGFSTGGGELWIVCMSSVHACITNKSCFCPCGLNVSDNQ